MRCLANVVIDCRVSKESFFIKKLFVKGSHIGLRLFIFISLSVIAIVLDMKFNYFISIRAIANETLSPLYLVADFPQQAYKKFNDFFVVKSFLIKENHELKEQLLLLKVKEQRLIALENENTELKQVLTLKSIKEYKNYLIAEIVYLDTNGLNQQVVINKGKADNIKEGQLIVDMHGVIGQIISVDTFFSRVMLITDRKSAIPVVNLRNGMRFLAVGSGDPNCLELAHISETTDIKVGDIIVSSSIGSQIKFGYKVGLVKDILHIVGERFVKVKVLPYGSVNSSRYVLISSSRNGNKSQSEQNNFTRLMEKNRNVFE